MRKERGEDRRYSSPPQSHSTAIMAAEPAAPAGEKAVPGRGLEPV